MNKRVICSRLLDECLSSSEIIENIFNKFLSVFRIQEQNSILELKNVDYVKLIDNEINKIKVFDKKDKFLILAIKQSDNKNEVLKCVVKSIGLNFIKNQESINFNNLDKNNIISFDFIDKLDETNNITCYYDVQKVGDMLWVVSKQIARNYKFEARENKMVLKFKLKYAKDINKEFTA